jgi:hypothetical protein
MISGKSATASRSPLLLLLLLLLACQAVLHLASHTPKTGRVGIDLYQYWGVGRVIALSRGTVRNPYLEQPEFNRILGAAARRSSDPAHRAVARHRKDLELQGTPAAYLLFSGYPASYRTALELHHALQIAAFALAVGLLLGPLSVVSWLAALALIPVYAPLTSETTVGNFNCFLLLGLVASYLLLRRSRDSVDRRTATLTGAAALGLVGGLALVKPSLALVFPAMALALPAMLGARRGLTAAAGGTGIVVVLATLPMLFFETPSIWLDWRSYFANSNLDMYQLPFEAGNLSAALMLSTQLELPFALAALLIGSVLVASLLGAAARHGKLVLTLKAMLADPACAVALGVLMFFAVSPLVWVHYHLLLLVPALALMRGGFWWAPALSATSIALAAATPITLLPLMGTDPQLAQQLAYYGIMLAWPLLWLALLGQVGHFGSVGKAA